MPIEPLALDELPEAEPLFGEPADGKVQCPECDKSFIPSGLKRHITMSHRGGVSDSAGGSTGKGKSKVVIDVAERWAQFQRGAALMVSFACSQCASVLVTDADKDGKAIAEFCVNRPKLRKNVEKFLDTSDMLILVGTLGETARTMASHHDIGRKIGLADTSEHMGHDATGMQGVAAFMQSMSPEDRQAILDQALANMAGPAPAPEPVMVPDWSPDGVPNG